MGIERYRGDTSSDKMIITGPTGLPVNLTGSTILFTLCSVRNPVDNSTDIYQLAGVVTNPLSGIVEFTPSAAQTNRIGIFYYDVQLTDSNGVIHTVAKDSYTFIQDITK